MVTTELDEMLKKNDHAKECVDCAEMTMVPRLVTIEKETFAKVLFECDHCGKTMIHDFTQPRT